MDNLKKCVLLGEERSHPLAHIFDNILGSLLGRRSARQALAFALIDKMFTCLSYASASIVNQIDLVDAAKTCLRSATRPRATLSFSTCCVAYASLTSPSARRSTCSWTRRSSTTRACDAEAAAVAAASSDESVRAGVSYVQQQPSTSHNASSVTCHLRQRRHTRRIRTSSTATPISSLCASSFDSPLTTCARS